MYTSPSRSSLFKGKFFVFLATLFLFGTTLFFSRNFLLLKSVDIALQSMFPKSKTHKIIYEKANWEGSHVVVSGLHLTEDDLDVVIDQLEMDFHFSIKKLFFQPHLKLVHPQIRILNTQPSESHSANVLGAFLPTAHFCLKTDVQSGVLQVDNQRLYFSFQSKEEKEELGTLYVTHDPSLIRDSYLVAEFQMHERALNCALTVQQMGLERILQLLTLVQPQFAREWQNVQGQTQLKGKASISFSGEIEELSCQFWVQNLALANSAKKIAASAEKFEGNFYYPTGNQSLLPWQQVVSLMQLEKGEVHFLDAWNLTGLQGKLSLDPKEDPLLELTGNLQGLNLPLKFKLEGKGALHEDESFWLDLAMRLFDNQEKEAAFHLSLCRPEKHSLVIQTEFQEMLGEQLDFFRPFFITAFPEIEKWKILEGNFNGKCIARMDKSALSRIELDHFEGKQIVLSQSEQLLPIETLKLDGRFTQVSPKTIGELNLDASFPFAAWSHFFGLAADAPSLGKSSHLVSNLKWKKGNSKVTGSFIASDPQDILQFGFECAHFFPKSWGEIKEGWLHSSSLSPVICQPILKQLGGRFNLQGELDIYGTFDGKELQLSLQTNALKAAFPSFYVESGAIGEKDPMLLKTEGRAKLNFDLSAGSFDAKIPLKGAQVYDQSGQFVLSNVEGDLIFTIDNRQKKIQGNFEHAQLTLSNDPFLNEVKFLLDVDTQTGEVLLENISGRVAFSEEAPCYFSTPALHLKNENSSFEAKITQNGKELVQISALALKSAHQWRAGLKFSKEMPVQGSFEAILFSDPAKHYLALDTSGQDLTFWGKPIQNFALTLKKQQGDWLIEKLKVDDLNFKGKGSYENRQAHITQFDLNYKDLSLQGSANAELHPANQGQDWVVQAELGFDASTALPCALQFHFHPGMKLAFSPASGLVVSDIHFIGENSECAVDYLEYLPKTQKWKAQSCRALIAPELYYSLASAGVIPKSMQKIELKEPVKAIFNLNLEKQNTQLLGKIFQGFYWTEKKQDLLFNFEHSNNCKGKLVLQEASREERMQLDLNFNLDGDVLIDKISGATCGLIAHLKRDEAKQGLLAYTGEIKLDFNELRAFLPKEMQEKVESWKMGNGYQLQGQFVVPPGGYKELKFFGKLSGEEFEYAGLKLKKLETKAILSAEEAIFDNFIIKDEVGNLNIKRMHWTKEAEDAWSFSIPLLSIQDLSPHLITKEKNKNLLIKQGTMTHFSGNLNDLSSFVGQGSFHFTSRSKKDFSLFEVPIEMIKNLGIDPGLLTPIAGEVDFEFQQGKCVITKLKNVRSEGGRSEFYLPAAPMTSYLDLNGNVYVDLKMKQNVVLNLTEPFTLSIRGTFKEPRYSLR
ncbi:MAG TPA: hypothetical protein VLG76_08510 [Rhabdochlamydiaceae bacterium]|nr:hypothetical protein [Rhabdochlamydiaceae bacterium]